MTKHFSKPSIRKSVVSVAALAGLASIALLIVASPAAAAANTAASCAKKQQACSQRCDGAIPKGIGSNKANDMLVSCIRRTCNKQYDNCMKNSVGSGGSKAETPRDPLHPKGGNPHMPPTEGGMAEPKAPPKVNETRSPLGGGLLGDGLGMGTTGPSATGSPGSTGGRAPAAAPIQLR